MAEEAIFTLANEKPRSLPEGRLWRVPAHGRLPEATSNGFADAQHVEPRLGCRAASEKSGGQMRVAISLAVGAPSRTFTGRFSL